MASLLELGVQTGKWDSGLKKAKESLDKFIQANGGLTQALDKESSKMSKFVQMMGGMESKAKTAKGQMNEYKQAIERLTMQYNRMTDAQRKTVGQDYLRAIDQLKTKYREAADEAKRFNQELDGKSGGVSNFSSIIGELGGKFGLSSEAVGVLTTGTIGLTAAVTAGTAAVAAAAKGWADYNAELARMDSITSVTTGLKGEDADTLTTSVKALADTYDVDFREAINAANTLMTQFGESGESAFALLRAGMQGMIEGDGPKLLSMIQQYSPAFRDAGVSASQLVAVIHNTEGGIFTDDNMNAIVMGIKNIRLMTDKTAEALGNLGINGEEMTQKLNDGSITVFDALRQVSDAIDTTASGSQAAGEVMQQVFGKQGVAAGTNLGKAIETLNLNLEETMLQTGEVGEEFDRLYEANRELEQAMRDCFGYDGWRSLANGIKTELIGALTFTIETINEAKNALLGLWNMISGGPSGSGSGSGSGGGDKPTGTVYGTGYTETTDANGNILKATRNGVDITDQVVGVTVTGHRRKSSGGGRRSGGGGGRSTGRSGGGRTNTRREETPQEKAEKTVAAALAAYAKTISTADMRLAAGMDNTVDRQNAELQARERLTMAYAEAYNIYQDPKYKDSFERAAGEFNAMADVVKGKREEFEAATGALAGMSVNPMDGVLKGLLGEDMQAHAKRKGINLDTGDGGTRKETAADVLAKTAGKIDKHLEPFSTISSGLQEMGIKVPEGIERMIAITQGVSTILTGISALLALIQIDTKVTAAATATDAIVPFARGGIAHAASGMLVGHHYSGDMVPALLNDGELILNRAQQGNVASQLTNGGLADMQLEAVLDGEDIRIAVRNGNRRRGRGEYITSKSR